MRSGRFGLLVSLVVVLSLAVSASAAAGAAEAYVIGYETDASGPGRDSYLPDYEGFAAYMDEVNRRGGINGHPVRVVVEDVQLDPVKAGAGARKLIEQDGAILLAGLTLSTTLPAVFAQARAAQVPVISGHSASPDAFPPADPLIFTLESVFEMYSDAHVAATRDVFRPGTRIGCTIHETVAAIAICGRKLTNYARHGGMVAAGSFVTAPPATTDYTPYAQRLLAQNPEVVWSWSTARHMIGMATAMVRLGYRGAFATQLDAVQEFSVAQVIQQVGDANPWYGVNPHVSPDDRGIPEVDRMLQALRRTGAQLPPSSGHVRGWLLGMVVEEALDRCGWPCTPKRLTQVLNRGDFKVDTKGLRGGPVEWTAQDHVGPQYFMVYRYDRDQKRWVRARQDWVKFTVADVFSPIK